MLQIGKFATIIVTVIKIYNNWDLKSRAAVFLPFFISRKDERINESKHCRNR